MLQQFRHLFDHLVYGEVQKAAYDAETTDATPTTVTPAHGAPVKSVVVVETPAAIAGVCRAAVGRRGSTCAACGSKSWPTRRRKLEPEGALTGATRELQAGLGDVPADLPRARRQGRPVAAAARRRRVDLRRAPDLRRRSRSPTGSARTASRGRSASACSSAAAPASRRTWRSSSPSLDIDAAGHRSPDPAAARGRPGPDRQEQDALAGRRTQGAGTPGWSRCSLEHFAMLYGFPRWLAALSEVAAAGPAAAEPGRPDPGAVREAAGAGVHAGIDVMSEPEALAKESAPRSRFGLG